MAVPFPGWRLSHLALKTPSKRRTRGGGGSKPTRSK